MIEPTGVQAAEVAEVVASTEPGPAPAEEPGGGARGTGSSAAAVHRGREQHHHLRLAVALSIAVVSVLGALVSWRAEVMASRADEADQEAVAAALAGADQSAQAQSTAVTAAADAARVQRLDSVALGLQPTGCGTVSLTTRAGVDAQVNCALARIFTFAGETGYANGSGAFDATAFANDAAAWSAPMVEEDPGPAAAAAAADRGREHHLLWLSVALVVALACFTAGRLATGRRRVLAFAVPGWAVLAACTAGLVMIGI